MVMVNVLVTELGYRTVLDLFICESQFRRCGRYLTQFGLRVLFRITQEIESAKLFFFRCSDECDMENVP